MESVVVDTGVWYALFDSRDNNYGQADEKAELLSMLNVVVPWPTAYETLRTRFVKNAAALRQFELFLKSSNVLFLEDEEYRASAFELSLDSALRKTRPLSMVDCLIRLIIDDPNVNIRYLATFNVRDFFDVCAKNGVEIL
jgi:predicted nucleic acid-binding protein